MNHISMKYSFENQAIIIITIIITIKLLAPEFGI